MLTSAEFTNNGAGSNGVTNSNGGRPTTNCSGERFPSEGRNFMGVIGDSSALKKVLREVEIVAQTDSTVLIMGETGTGKELIAKSIHQSSRRAKNTFVKLNSATIPAASLEAELFGHERGAFTGAITQRVGRFETADKGTLFLDEIGEMPIQFW